jgi:hypothetical protein
MGRWNSVILLVLFGFAVLAFGMQAPKSLAENGEFRWLDTSGNTEGIKYPTRQLQPLSLQAYAGPPAEIEREETRLDSQTTRITSRAFNTAANGERRLVETIVEEIKKTPSGEMSAVRTMWRRDVNGQMNVAQKETQEVASSANDTYRITKTLLLPGINSALVEKEQVQQIEKRKGESLVEIDRTSYELGADGKWNTLNRRVSQNRQTKDQTQTDEQVYRYDVNRQLSLTQQVKVSEWKDASGQKRLESETFTIGLDGKLQLESRSSIVQRDMGSQRREATEIIEAPNPAAPSEGLKVVRKLIENSQPLGPNQTERKLEVLKPDLNGGMQTIHNQTTIEKK